MTTSFSTAFSNLITKLENNFIWLKTQVTNLVTSVGTKASATDLSTHTGNTTVHITSTERDTWNGKQDALTSTQLGYINAVPNKADASSVPTKFSDLTDDLNLATQSYVDGKTASAFSYKGSVTFANLPSLSSVTDADVGSVYNVSDDFTLTSDFIEYESGKTKTIKGGTNVTIAKVNNAYKYDASAGFIDLSGYYEISTLDTALSGMFTTGAGNITDLSDNSNSNS